MLRFLLIFPLVCASVGNQESNVLLLPADEDSTTSTSTTAELLNPSTYPDNENYIESTNTTSENSTEPTTTIVNETADDVDDYVLPVEPNRSSYDELSRLVEFIIKNQTSDVAPMFQRDQMENNILNYTLFIGQLKVIGVDDVNELVTIAAEVYQLWNDTRLAWNSSEFDNIQTIFTRQHKIWSPPMVVFSATELVDQRDNEFRMVSITNEGRVRTYIPLKLTTTCKMNTVDFPFDDQTCVIRISLPPVPQSVYRFQVVLADSVKHNLCAMSNSAWEMYEIFAYVNVTQTRFEGIQYVKQGNVVIRLKRCSGYYMVMIVLPITVINGLSLVGVFMKSKNGNLQRLTVGLTHVMTMTFILAMLGEKLPRTDSLPLLGKYIIISLCVMIIATIISTKKHRILACLEIQSEYIIVNSNPNRSSSTPRTRQIRIRTFVMVIFLILNLFGALYMFMRFVYFLKDHKREGNACSWIPTNEQTLDGYAMINETELPNNFVMQYGFLLSTLITIFSKISFNESFQFSHYMPPFNDSSRIYQLCTAENDKHFLNPKYYENLMNFYIDKYTLCWTEYEKIVPNKHFSIIWFLRALTGCEVSQTLISKLKQRYHRKFYFEFVKYSYIMICEKGHLIQDKDHLLLSSYAGLFNTLYQVVDSNRQEICTKISNDYSDLYRRCYVPKFERREMKIQQRCNAVSAPLLKFHDFFLRFSRDECTTFENFVYKRNSHMNIGKALIGDVDYMNIISSNLVAHINSDSDLPNLVLKTRLILQHFSIASIKLFNQLEKIEGCVNDFRNNMTEISNITDINEEEKTRIEMHRCCPFNNTNICELKSEKYQDLAYKAFLGFRIEGCLLIAVFINTILLAMLLYKTQKNLSTATVLFVFNIMFSNVLFMMSFSFFFVDLNSNKPYGSEITDGYEGKAPQLIIAETLQTHVFASTEFRKHLVQETLYSLAQNGSLTGLIHLLVLVLVVINRSMSGKSIHLSRVSVISVFACVWIFLIASHAMFSTMQMNAIQNLDKLFAVLARGKKTPTNCKGNSDYEEIGSHCDRTAVFHSFGVYLLRGHTIFTVLFLSASIVIFVITVTYHINVRRQHEIIHSELRNQSPHLRRERLFHTLILSIIIFFLSVLGQTYIEIAVFWYTERTIIAKLAEWYHLARILAFVDPVMNPLIVILRTPALRRQLRSQWSTFRSRASSKTRSRDGHSHRGESIKKSIKREASSVKLEKETELMLKNATDRPLTRTCSQRRSQDSQTHNSVV
ncbi:unnamed protein product [Caenorhabditis angaria]|uniref:G-protein coupled receptors family 1 profile domain-containing protein n=1 Tax=Caenorhabditis angaria TaxID=860376 RepID=A0A9P1N9F0_9PELO|nr:unnamed protein product [Caenorhabditis angaria]